LADLCTIYSERFQGPPLHRTALAAELAARRAFVEAVEGVWRECRRKRGRGSSYREVIRQREVVKKVHDGPLLRLLLKLFEAMREPNPPSAATLHHDLDFLRTGRERTRGGKRKRSRSDERPH
jgi:hypothetical protein